MNEGLVKNLISRLHPTAKYLTKIRLHQEIPFFCVVTPVFDPALDALKTLIKDLKNQTFTDFNHVVISNGRSARVHSYLKGVSKKDRRFVYDELPQETVITGEQLLINLGKRRNYCLKKYVARRYLFLDADLKILDKNFLSKVFLADKLTKKDIILTKTRTQGQILPKFPLGIGRLDISNFSFSRRIAETYNYPSSFNPETGWGNDYPFFLKIYKPGNSTFLDFVAAEKDANRSYKRTSDVFLESALSERIPVFGNSFHDEDTQAIAKVLSSHLVGVGQVTEEFEQKFRKKIGFSYAVATNSCTNAFWLLFKALGLKASDEVIIPNIHFFGIKNVLDLLQINYQIADVGTRIPNLTVEAVREKLTKKTKAIVFLEYGGYPVEIYKIGSFLKKINRPDIYLILDASNSPFTQVNDEYTARSYDFSILSFDMNKMLVTGDGGMVLSDNKDVIEKIRKLSFYGLADGSKSSFEKSLSQNEWWAVNVEEPSLKMAMNNLSASLGISQLAKSAAILKKREEIRISYLQKLSSLADKGLISLPPSLDKVKNHLYLFWIKLRNKETRDKLARFLLERKVYTTVKYQPLSEKEKTPNAFDFYNRALCLPFNQNLSYPEQEYVISQIYGFFEQDQN